MSGRLVHAERRGAVADSAAPLRAWMLTGTGGRGIDMRSRIQPAAVPAQLTAATTPSRKAATRAQSELSNQSGPGLKRLATTDTANQTVRAVNVTAVVTSG